MILMLLFISAFCSLHNNNDNNNNGGWCQNDNNNYEIVLLTHCIAVVKLIKMPDNDTM